MIIGGGPAGLAAARTAARHGVRVTLVDDNAALGGQYYRQLPPWFRAPAGSVLGRESEAGRALIAEVQALGVELRLGATAWGIFDQRTVAIATHDRTEQIRAEALVLAPGAYDRPVPFPGWTLPGVMTAGGAQNLMKGSAVLPGRRVLVAGSGPLLLVVAHTLLEAGARVEAVCEGKRLAIFVNGVQVNEAIEVSPASGRILLQCEGHEVFFRKVVLHPLPEKKP